jgi:hypothetical protein
MMGMLVSLRLAWKLGRATRPRQVLRAIRRPGPGRGSWVTVAVVVGMFAMHGMGDHGVHTADHRQADGTVAAASGPHTGSGQTGPAPMTPGSVKGPQTPSHRLESDQRPVTETTGTNGSDADASHARSSQPMAASIPDPIGAGGVLGLCLTLLSSALILLLLRLAGRQTAPALAARASARAGTVSPARARGSGPPLRSQLCIWRC